MVLRLAISIIAGVLLGAAMGYLGQCSSGACPLTANWWRGAIYGGVMGLLVGMSFVTRP